MFKFIRTKLDAQIDNELNLCERELLEAEGAQECWNAKVDMLRARRSRLMQRQAMAMREADGLPSFEDDRQMTGPVYGR